ncbi:MAG: N-formylglutamate amidohydrolase [Magnetovibrio sp.]|nr:N-formylglutamate amidohydrolase [Magnetovibrio sp.]
MARPGAVPKVVANGEAIYDSPITFASARQRIERHHRPYHRALTEVLDATHRRFGGALLVDCHSMPSAGAPGIRAKGLKNVDIVLGDCHGAACAQAVTALAEKTLKDLNYRVVRNRPYAGGYITRRYGRPEEGMHALQIEINRALYMDEHRIERGPGMAELIRHVGKLIKVLTELDLDILKEDPKWLPKAAE